MSLSNNAEITQAATIAALTSEIIIHPMDTIITRMQSPMYKTIYKHSNGTLSRAIFHGLYQGFGPTLLAGTLSSAAFFTTYEASKKIFENAQSAGYMLGVPRPIFQVASSAVAELVACAILNPAEVLKQNAQVIQRSPSPAVSGTGGRGLSTSPTVEILKQFQKQPSKLWTGYTALVASQLPSICLTFYLYEMIKETLLERWKYKKEKDDTAQQLQATILSAGIAGGCASLLFVPIDVVKTRMRLAVGDHGQTGVPRLGLDGAKVSLQARTGAFTVTRDVVCKEGISGLFRGSGLTFVAAVVGSALYIGCYEGCKLYLYTS